MKMLTVVVFMICAISILASLSPALAQSGPVALQGKLDGVGDGERNFTLTIWNSPTGGSALASVEGTTMVQSGVFTLLVDLPAAAFPPTLASNRWWSVSIDGSADTQRQLVANVPSALVSRRAHELIQREGEGRLSISEGQTSTSFRFQSRTADTPLNISWRRGDADSLGFVLRLSRPTDGNSFGMALRPTGLETQPIFFMPASTGNIGIRTYNPSTALHVAGTTRTNVLQITGGSDLAEPFASSPSQPVTPQPGMVLSIDPEHPGALRVSTEAYDTKVAGVYSGGNGLNTGMLMGQEGCDLTSPGEDRLPLAMTGRVWVYADDSNGPITPGDRLTTSGINAGYAARVADETRAPGTVIGKAMTPIDSESGMVLVLVNLQ